MTKARSGALPSVALLARWDGFCLPCGSEQRPLVLTWAGRRGMRAWLSGHGFADGQLRLVCACCGGVDVVGWEDEPEPHRLLDEVAVDPGLVPAAPRPPVGAPAPMDVTVPLLSADASLPAPRRPDEVVVADVMAELAALHVGQDPSGPPTEADEPVDVVPLPRAALPSEDLDGPLDGHPPVDEAVTTLDALLGGPPQPADHPVDALLPPRPAEHPLDVLLPPQPADRSVDAGVPPADVGPWFAVHVAPAPSQLRQPVVPATAEVTVDELLAPVDLLVPVQAGPPPVSSWSGVDPSPGAAEGAAPAARHAPVAAVTLAHAALLEVERELRLPVQAVAVDEHDPAPSIGPRPFAVHTATARWSSPQHDEAPAGPPHRPGDSASRSADSAVSTSRDDTVVSPVGNLSDVPTVLPRRAERRAAERASRRSRPVPAQREPAEQNAPDRLHLVG